MAQVGTKLNKAPVNYGERREQELNNRMMGTPERRQAPAPRDKYVTPAPKKNLQRNDIQPKAQSFGWKVERHGKHLPLMALEKGQYDEKTASQPTRKQCLDILDGVLSNEKFSTAFSIKESVKKQYETKEPDAQQKTANDPRRTYSTGR